MARWWMEIAEDCPAPKRGDLLQSNMGGPRERTWIVLRAVPRRENRGYNVGREMSGKRRFNIIRARWWELEPDMRMRLYRSAARNGGQIVWHTYPLKKQKPRGDFESLIKAGLQRQGHFNSEKERT